MTNMTSDWKLSGLRWVVWLILCFGMAFEIFLIKDTVTAVATRVFAEQAIQEQKAGKIPDTFQMENSISFDQLTSIFVGGILAVALAVGIDYYFRAGEKKGRLWPRVGLVAGLEVAILVVALLLQVIY